MQQDEKQPLFQHLKKWARSLKQQLLVLYVAYKDERVPWYAKLFTILVVAYAFSPIDLIPDFIPILGYLDDIILVPLGIYIALKLIPTEVIEDSTAKLQAQPATKKPKNWIAAGLILLLWLLLFVWVVTLIF